VIVTPSAGPCQEVYCTSCQFPDADLAAGTLGAHVTYQGEFREGNSGDTILISTEFRQFRGHNTNVHGGVPERSYLFFSRLGTVPAMTTT
jgi:hypothetical protein